MKYDNPSAMWIYALSPFAPSFSKIKIWDIEICICSFSNKIYPLGLLEEVINDAKWAVGFLQVDNGMGQVVPCVIYDMSRLGYPSPYSNVEFKEQSPLAAVLEDAYSVSKYAENNRIAIFQSAFNPNLIGWMLEYGKPVRISDEEPSEFWLRMNSI